MAGGTTSAASYLGMVVGSSRDDVAATGVAPATGVAARVRMVPGLPAATPEPSARLPWTSVRRVNFAMVSSSSQKGAPVTPGA